MSLFKVKEWWSSGGFVDGEEADILNDTLRTAQLGPEGSGDMILYGSPKVLYVYKPQGEFQPTDVILEYTTPNPILQIQCGKLTPNTTIESIAILYPRSVIVYVLSIKEGLAEYGDHNILYEQYEHKLPRSAYCFLVGPFGGVKNKDFICVQSLDGLLMFYEQDVATFTCFLPDVLIPGPMAYSRCMDIFVTCNSNWTIEAYSYYNLSHTSDKTMEKSSSGKKLTPNWTYSVGENILSIETVQVTNSSCCFILFGEKFIYCLHDNGILKFMKKFDYNPICCMAYLVGWYYENNARLMIVVVSDDSTVYIYEQVTLLWSCRLTFTPVCIKRGFFPSLPGALIALTDSGEIKCCYMGTEPELFTAPSLPNSETDFAHAQEELNRLQSIINNQQNISEVRVMNKSSEKELQFKIHISNDMEINDINDSNVNDQSTDIKPLKCKVQLFLKSTVKDNIEFIQVTFSTVPPLMCTNEVECINIVREEHLVETYVYASQISAVPTLTLSVSVMYTNKLGNIRILQRDERLPFKLLCHPFKPSKDAKYKVTLSSEKPTIDLMEIVNDFDQESLTNAGCSSGVLAFSIENSDNYAVTLIGAKSSQRYRFQCNDPSILGIFLEEFIFRINSYMRKRPVSGNEKYNVLKIDLDNDMSHDILKYFYKIIERHALIRRELVQKEMDIEILCSQFILIQKKLMMKYKERAPSSCDGIHFLLGDTHHKIIDTTRDIQRLKKEINDYRLKICSMVELFSILLVTSGAKDDEVDYFKCALMYKNLRMENDNWEENTGRNIYHVLTTSYIKNDKEKDKLIQFNYEESFEKFDLPRFIKYMSMFLDKAFKMSVREEKNNDHDENLEKDIENDDNVEKDMLKIPEGSLFGHHEPILTARWEKQKSPEHNSPDIDDQ